MNRHPHELAARGNGVAAGILAALAIALLAPLPAIAGTEHAAIGSHTVAHSDAAMDASPTSVTGAFTPYRYLRIAGAAFHPVSNNVSFAYAGAGCINRTGAAMALFTHKVVLPQRSVVKFLRLYYNDTSASDITAFFTSYDQLGGFVEYTSVGSAGNSGYDSSLSPEITKVVDHFAQPLVVTVNMDASVDATLQFCGVRIAYIDIADDTIFENGFD
jgi:hypothetical protein